MAAGKIRTAREYVSNAELKSEIDSWLSQTHLGFHHLAELAGVSPRAVSKVLRCERDFQTIYLADKLMLAMDRDLYKLRIQTRERKAARQ